MTIDKAYLQRECLEAKDLVVRFFKNPIHEIRNLPDWSWPKILIFLAVFSAICGGLAGVVERKVLTIISGLLFNPFVTLSLAGASTLFFGIFFKIFSNRDLAWRKLFTLVVFSNLPNFVFSVGASYIPPIIPLGLACTAFLLIKGLIENFNLERKLVTRLIAGLYIVFFLSWVIKEIRSDKFPKTFEDDNRSAPEVHLGK